MVKCNKYLSVCLCLLLVAMIFSGCATRKVAGPIKNMQQVTADKISTVPEQGKSMVIFLRPNTLGYNVQSSVFEMKGETPLLVGIVAAWKKLVYQLEPGEHLFMVVGESADFMSADLEANKIYYALVTPRMGAWKARFSLQPIHKEQLGTTQFNEWLTGCEWVQKSSESDTWANENMPSIQTKYNAFYKKWMEKDASERPKLIQQDGK
jgi:hypothetical protein